MANEYEKIALATRRKVSKLTLDQQRQMLKLYEDSISNLATKITKSKDKSLSQRWLTDYQKELKSVSNTLAKDIESSTEKAIGNAAKIGTETEQQIMSKIFKQAGIDTGDHFTSMFSQVQNRVVENIINGNLYKDKLTLSQRIWSHSGAFERDIQYVINQGILEKKSAIELARDLEQFVKDPARRPTTWGSAYPNLRNRPVEYNSMRLARTTINHSYQDSTIQSSNMNPFVEGIEWQSAQIHGRTCDLCLERHGQVFPKDNVPLDHPNGLCAMLPHIPKDSDAVADELRAWIDGGDNPTLDKWYNDHGEHFSGIRIDNIKEETVPEFNTDNYKKVTEDDVYDYVEGAYSKLTDNEKYSLEGYVGSPQSFKLNSYIYSGEYEKTKALLKETKKLSPLVDQIDELSNVIKKHSLPENMKLNRMVDDNFLGSVLKGMGVDNAEGIAKGAISDKATRDELESILSGVEYTNKSFLSTSYDMDQNRFGNRPIRMELYADKGTNAIITDNHMESEVLFDKDTKVEFIGFDSESIMFDNISREMIDRLIVKVRVLGG